MKVFSFFKQMISTTLFTSYKICNGVETIAEVPTELRITSSSLDSLKFQKEIIARVVNKALGNQQYSFQDVVSLNFNSTFDWSTGTLQRWLSQIGSMGNGVLCINVAVNPVGISDRTLSRGLTTTTTIILAVVLVVVFLVVLAVIIYFVWRANKKKKKLAYLGPTGFPTPSVY